MAKRLNGVFALNAMALDIPTDGHPNKMPFSGVLTRIDQPSDAAPEGSGGKRITISAAAAEKGLASLLGMAVDYKLGWDGHDAKQKIGVITAANIDGDAIKINGFIYAADFPDEAAEIKANKDKLGFSYEARDAYTNDADANPCVITECQFTGAAILLRDKAAYRSTSISASADKEELNMDKKELGEILAAALKPVTDQLASVNEKVVKLETDKIEAANMLPKVEPFAANLEAAADKMESAGIGGDASNGHAKVLRRMAGHMRAEAAQGRMPSSFSLYAAATEDRSNAAQTGDVTAAVEAATKPLLDQLAAMGTQVADLKAAAEKKVEAPERKTIPPVITTLLANAGVQLPEGDGKISVATLDKGLKDLPLEQRLSVKTGLRKAGMLGD